MVHAHKMCWFFLRDNGTWSTIIFLKNQRDAIDGSKGHATFESARQWQLENHPDSQMIGGGPKERAEIRKVEDAARSV